MRRAGPRLRLPVLAAAALAMLSALGGCGPGGESALRDPLAPIASTTRFDADRFAGEWHVVARVATADDEQARAPERFSFAPGGEGALSVRHRHERCNDFECIGLDEQKPARVSGPGRITMDLGHGAEELWVLWVDADFRTAAIGTPSGRFGWVMEKGARAPGRDRFVAATEILDWVGYDLSRLVEVSE